MSSLINNFDYADFSNSQGRMWENPGTSLITFGQPRVGDKEFSNIHDQMISPFRKLRFVMNLDPVPHLPLWPGSVHHSR